jgi:hypothetical protein
VFVGGEGVEVGVQALAAAGNAGLVLDQAEHGGCVGCAGLVQGGEVDGGTGGAVVRVGARVAVAVKALV